jgi:hypothetical protein
MPKLAQIFHLYSFNCPDMQTDKNKIAGANTAKNAEEKKAAEIITAAHDEAINDIEQDPDFSIHSANDDLDEGETARLGEDKPV